MILVLLLAVHELVKVVFQVHFLIGAVAYLGLPFTEQVNQEITSLVAIEHCLCVVLEVILVCNVSWSCANALRALLQSYIIGSIIDLARHSESILCRRLYFQINNCKIFQDYVIIVNDYLVIHSYLDYAVLEGILLFFLLFLILIFHFLLHFLFLEIHLVCWVFFEAAPKFWLNEFAVVILVTIVDDDWRLVLFLESRQTILLLLLLNLLLLLYSVVARIGVNLLLDLVVTNHKRVVTVLGLF